MLRWLVLFQFPPTLTGLPDPAWGPGLRLCRKSCDLRCWVCRGSGKQETGQKGGRGGGRGWASHVSCTWGGLGRFGSRGGMRLRPEWVPGSKTQLTRFRRGVLGLPWPCPPPVPFPSRLLQTCFLRGGAVRPGPGSGARCRCWDRRPHEPTLQVCGGPRHLTLGRHHHFRTCFWGCPFILWYLLAGT